MPMTGANMPIWPFIMLGAIFVAVLILPPLVAAWIDYRSELRREAGRDADRDRDREQPSRTRGNRSG